MTTETQTYPYPRIQGILNSAALNDGLGSISATTYGRVCLINIYINELEPSGTWKTLFTDERLGTLGPEDVYFSTNYGIGSSLVGFVNFRIRATGAIEVASFSDRPSLENIHASFTYIIRLS